MDRTMTQEDKQLLLKDLCSRLPYNPKVKYAHYHKNGDDEDIVLNVYNAHKLLVGMDIYRIKPYLRPMSSMTEEEIREFIQICDTVLWLGDKRSTCILSLEQTDWLNARHFDYRGLIDKGLAIEVPEGMYNTKTE